MVFGISTIAFVGGIALFPPLGIPLAAIELYTAQKLLNNTKFKSFKDLAFMVGKKGKNEKIYQDVIRPDIFRLIRNMDKREKLGFLQLQMLVGLTKFDARDKRGNLQTIETDSHGIIRNTFQKLTELGYLQNYNERHIKDSNLILPKLAFANGEISKKVPIYNMTFQKTERQIDFDDPNFRKMFPMVFSKRGILAKRGYTIKRNSEGRLEINYGKGRKREKNYTIRENQRDNFRERVKVEESLEDQKIKIEKFIEEQSKGTSIPKDVSIDKDEE